MLYSMIPDDTKERDSHHFLLMVSLTPSPPKHTHFVETIKCFSLKRYDFFSRPKIRKGKKVYGFVGHLASSSDH